MNFEQAIKSGFANYANFKDRAARSEFWWFTLFCVLLRILAIFPGILRIIGVTAALVVLVPSLSIGVRRLHDVGRSGWWLLISFTVVGFIPLIYWWTRGSDRQKNEYGPSPEVAAGGSQRK